MQAYFGKQAHFDQTSAILDSYWEEASVELETNTEESRGLGVRL